MGSSTGATRAQKTAAGRPAVRATRTTWTTCLSLVERAAAAMLHRAQGGRLASEPKGLSLLSFLHPSYTHV